MLEMQIKETASSMMANDAELMLGTCRGNCDKRSGERNMKAWLVTWEWLGDHAAVEQPIVSILSPRLSDKTVRKHVEQLYADLSCSFGERLLYLRKPGENPHPAEFDRKWIIVDKSGRKGPMLTGRIHCGHNPHLHARKVADIKVQRDEDGNERLCWTEIPIPESPYAERGSF